MPKFNERGIAHIFIIIVLLLGLVLAAYLVTQRTNFFSKASVSTPVSPQTSFTFKQIGEAIMGQELQIKVLVRSDIDATNLYNLQIKFPTDRLELVDIETDNSFISNWVEKFFDNSTGEISLVGGITEPGKTTNISDPGLTLATLIFEPKMAGRANLTVTDESEIYRYSDNKDIIGVNDDFSVNIVSIPTPTPYPFSAKFGSNMRSYLAENPNSTKISVIITAKSDISESLKSLGVTVRSVIGGGKVITADIPLENLIKILSIDDLVSINAPDKLTLTGAGGSLTGIKIPRCMVEWDGVPLIQSANTTSDVAVKLLQFKPGDAYVSTYLDGVLLTNGRSSGKDRFTWEMNSGKSGLHWLEFKINDWNGYQILGQDSSKTAVCSPKEVFLTTSTKDSPPVKVEQSKCLVEWKGVPKNPTANTDFSTQITVTNSKVGSGYVSVYLDGKRVVGGNIISKDSFKWKIQSGSVGNHTLEFKVNDWIGYGIKGEDPSVSATCAPSAKFRTVSQ